MLPLTATAQSNKREVFLLAGQSNREGHALIETFDSIGDDPAIAPLLKQIRSGVCKVKLGERTIEFPDKTRRNSHAEQRSYYTL